MEVVFSKPQVYEQQSEHTSTLIKKVQSKQIVYDTKPREIPGEHTLTIVNRADQHQIDKTTESEVEFIVSKPQKKAFIDQYQSSNNYDERYRSTTYEEEQDISGGEHTTTYFKNTRAKIQPVELVVDRPKQLPSVSKLIADISAETQITSIKPTKIILSEDSSVKLDMDITNKNLRERYDEMEIVLEKPLVRDSSTTLIANIQSGLELKSIHPTTTTTTQQKTIEETISTSTFILQQSQKQQEEETVELRIRKPHIQDSSTVVLADVQSELGIHGQLKPSPYIPQKN